MNDDLKMRVRTTAWTGAALLAVLVAAGTFGSTRFRIWGLDGFAFLSPVSRMAFLTVIFVACAALFVLLRFATERSPSFVFPYQTLYVAGFALLALLLPAATFLRGDGQLLINHLNIGQPASFRSPLYAKTVGLVFRVGMPFGLSPRSVYLLLDAMGAALYAAAALRFAARFKTITGTVFALIALTFTGAMPLLFGLVEHYALLHAVLIWSLVLGVEAIERGRFPLAALLLNLVAAAFHVSAVVTLPAFLYAFGEKRKSGVLWAGFLLAGFFGLIAAVLLFRSHLLAPFGPFPDDGYTIYSLRHILDLVNLDFWSIPVLLAVVFPVLFAARAVFPRSREADYLLAALIGAGGFALVFNPELGMARDADLLALYALPATLWALLALRNVEAKITPDTAAAVLLAGMLTVGAQTFSQHSENASVRRFIRLLELDPERSAYGYENLAMYYRGKGDRENEEEAYRKAVTYRENARYLVRLAQLALEKGAPEEAEKYCRRAIASDSAFALAYGVLGETLGRLNRFEEALTAFRKAIEIEPDNGTLYANLAAFLVLHGDYAEAEKVISEGMDKAPPNAQLYYLYGGLLQELQRTNDAMNAFEHARSIDPGGMWGTKAAQKQKELLRYPRSTP